MAESYYQFLEAQQQVELRHTRTLAKLPLSRWAYEEIRELLLKAGYSHAIHKDGLIDMHGIAVVLKEGGPAQRLGKVKNTKRSSN
jgi:hypothetical protein